MSCITDGVMVEPEVKTSAPPKQAYEHTFEIKLTVLSISTDPDLDAPRNTITGAPISFQNDRGEGLNLVKTPEIRRVKVSPNRIAFACPTKGCSLIWQHRVGVDDPKLTPKHCAYCANAARLAQSQFQRESNALHEAYTDLGDPPPAEDEEKIEEYNEKLADLMLTNKDFNARVDEHAFCYRVFDDKTDLRADPVRIEFNKVPLEEGKPFTI